MAEGLSQIGVDWKAMGDDIGPEDRERIERWYKEYHGEGDLALAPFIPFWLNNAPGVLFRYRRWVESMSLLEGRLSGAAMQLVLLHNYTAIGYDRGVLYELIGARKTGATKQQVLDTMAFAYPHSGPPHMSPSCAIALDYMDAWDGTESGDPTIWPDEWSIDPDAFGSGLDFTATGLTAGELDQLKAWYERHYGEVPAYVSFLADPPPRGPEGVPQPLRVPDDARPAQGAVPAPHVLQLGLPGQRHGHAAGHPPGPPPRGGQEVRDRAGVRGDGLPRRPSDGLGRRGRRAAARRVAGLRVPVRELRPLATDVGVLFEGPRWRDGRWWVADIFGRRVATVAPDGTFTPLLEVPTRPSGLGFLADGSLLIVSQLDSRILRRHPDGTVAVHADLSSVAGGSRGLLNDMVVGDDGRAWVGEFGFDIDVDRPELVPGHLYRVDPDGSVAEVADGLFFPNGMVLTEDGSTLIVGESFGGRYSAFAVQPDGTLGPRRTWAQLCPTPALGPLAEVREGLTFTPDGCGLDAEGRIWAADPFGRRVALIEEGGRIVEEVAAPDGQSFIACMLGGDDGRTLLISVVPSPRDHVNPRGGLATIRVDVPHGGRP